MDDRFEVEVQAIRSELADIRREFEHLEQQRLPRPRERLAGHEGFMSDFKMHLGDHILRLPGRIRIEQRIASLEQRIAELEARYGVDATLN
jgi:hypothetical protein